jgi:DNA-binding GntR family transcriptional regulator
MADPAGNAPRRPLARKSMPEALADDLRERVLAGELGEGRQLRQEEIAAEYGVSRMPVREALRQLEAEGLVRFHAYKGAVVTALSAEDVREVFDLRLLIEGDLLRRALPRLAEADLDAARRHARAFDEALAEGGAALRSLGELNRALHAALYAPAGRARSMAILRTLHYQAGRYVQAHVLFGGGQLSASAEHARLIELCAARDVEAAVAWLERHIRNACADLLAVVEHRPPHRARAAAATTPA